MKIRISFLNMFGVFVLLFFWSSCGEINQKIDDKMDALNQSVESLDSLANDKMNRVQRLDTLVNNKMEKLQKMDSLVNRNRSKLDSLQILN